MEMPQSSHSSSSRRRGIWAKWTGYEKEIVAKHFAKPVTKTYSIEKIAAQIEKLVSTSFNIKCQCIIDTLALSI